MTEISDSLRSLFSPQIKERDESYTVDILSSEIEHDAFAADETYRITTLAMESSADNTN